ncbi:hypothetical protein ACP70R_042246 [Stipagrostis hirtigluma subsp. patula]
MSAADALGLPPGFSFRPTDAELLELYLLPRAGGQAPALPGVVAEGAGIGAAVPPWKLMPGGDDDEGFYFFEPVVANAGRGCGGGRWTWVGQKRWPDALTLPGGERVKWSKFQLNLHPAGGRSGSTGWVMHEYAVTSPPSLSGVKLCHVTFSGHGRKRKRVPDGEGDDLEIEQLAPQAASQPPRKRAAVSPSPSASTTTFVDQELDALLANHNQDQFHHHEGSSSFELPPLVDQELLGLPLEHNQEHVMNQPEQPHDQDYEAYFTLLASGDGSSQEQMQMNLDHLLSNINCFPGNAETAYHKEENLQIPTAETEEQLPTGQESPAPWHDLEAFCEVPADIGDLCDVPKSPAGDGGGDCWDWESAFQEPE